MIDAGADFTSDDIVSTNFCGLNSDCQVYAPNRERSCPSWGGVDYTLGVYDDGDVYNASDIGETVVSYDEYTTSMCVDSAMCQENSYSHGACFDCDRFSTDTQADAYCTDESLTYTSITDADLDTLIADGLLQGQEDEDTSTGNDNCACLNYCFSSVVEYVIAETGNQYSAEQALEEVTLTYFRYRSRRSLVDSIHSRSFFFAL